MDIKVIVLDIDGTLFSDEKKILKETKKLLLKAQSLGYKVVLASGRPASGLWYIADELEMEKHHGLLCCFNGSQVVDCTTTDMLFNAPMSVDMGKRVLNHLKSFNVNPMVYKDAYLYVNDAYAYKVEYESRLGKLKVCEVDDLEDFLTWTPNKILASGDPEYLKENYELMAAPFKSELNTMFTADFYYEYTAQGIDKAKALDIALKQLGYTSDNCIAFGDAENDLSIIRYAKIGVAMGNATQQVKDEADYITLDNNSEGIAHALLKFIPELSA